MPERIQMSRRKGDRKPPNTRVVARPSKWGNPFRVGDYVESSTGRALITQEFAVEMYRLYIVHAMTLPMGQIKLDLETLRGKNLACWCKLSEPCHADVLLELANPGGTKE